MLLAAITCAVAAIQQWQQLRLVLEDDSESDDDGPKPKRRRCSRPRPVYSNSGWAVMLRDQRELLSDPTTTEAVYFRRRFRVPFPFFEELLREVKAGEWEGFTTTETDVGGRPCIPVELKVRAASRPILADERSGCSVAAVAPGPGPRATLTRGFRRTCLSSFQPRMHRPRASK